MKGGPNTYTYVSDNPINYYDWNGTIMAGPGPGPAGQFYRACMACMQSVAAPYGPLRVNDKYKHCMVGAEGARKCGKYCASLAATGKEIIDLLDGNPNSNPEWADATATFDGIDCAENGKCDQSDEECCKNKGHQP